MKKNICEQFRNLKNTNCEGTQLPHDNHLKINFETYDVEFGTWNIGKLTSLIVTRPDGTEQKIDLGKNENTN